MWPGLLNQLLLKGLAAPRIPPAPRRATSFRRRYYLDAVNSAMLIRHGRFPFMPPSDEVTDGGGFVPPPLNLTVSKDLRALSPFCDADHPHPALGLDIPDRRRARNARRLRPVRDAGVTVKLLPFDNKSETRSRRRPPGGRDPRGY